MNTDILAYAVYIILGLGVCIWIYHLILPSWRGYQNRKQPTITIRATVAGKAEDFSYTIHSNFYSRTDGKMYMLVFHTAEGQQVICSVPRDDYYNFKPGTNGILTYQGSKCEKFTPDK